MTFDPRQKIEINISPFVTVDNTKSLPSISADERQSMVDLLWLLNHREGKELANLEQRLSEARGFMNSYAPKLQDAISEIAPGVGDVHITHTLGVFKGSMEPSFKIEIDLNGSEFGDVNKVLVRFAEDHNQVEYHASSVLDALPEDTALNVLNPESRTAYVSNVAIRYDKKLSEELTPKLHDLVAGFAMKNHILGYTIIHPDGYDFYVVPTEGEKEDRSKANEFNNALLRLNAQLSVALMSEDVKAAYKSNYRYLYVARHGSEYGVSE